MTVAGRRRFLWSVVAGVYALLLLVVSVIPVDVEVGLPHVDKAVHVCEYLLFAWVLVQAVRVGSRLPRHLAEHGRGEPEGQYLLWVWIYATSYGLLIELIQAMIPWRSADIADGLSNAVGAAAGVWIGRRLPKPHADRRAA